MMTDALIKGGRPET